MPDDLTFLGKLFRHEGSRLRLELARRSGDAGAADDLLQELFLRAVRHADDLRDRPTHDRLAWLFKAARRLGVDHIRRRGSATRLYARQAARQARAGGPVTPYQVAVARDLRRHLDAEIRRLPEALRKTLRLELATGDASARADDLGVTASTVRWRLHAARRKLAHPGS
jgi:RNA polymerase sigma-70 factor (ECF subfamily)